MKTNVRYMGFGFPVILLEVESVEGEKGLSYLDIPHQKLARKLFMALLMKPASLTGAELKFLRKYLDMTQAEFAELVGAKSHSNIAMWERKGEVPTGMMEQAEMIARLKLAVEFSGGAISIEEVYTKLIKTGFSKEEKPIELKIQDVA